MSASPPARAEDPAAGERAGVWLFPVTYAVHLAEEYAVGGGFTTWARSTLAISFSDAEFLAWNAVGFVLMSVGALLVSRDPKFRFIEIALSMAVVGNGFAHLAGSLLTWTYSPGLVTGVALWMPLGALRLQSALRASSPKARKAGLYLGACVLLVMFLALVLSTALGPEQMGASRSAIR